MKLSTVALALFGTAAAQDYYGDYQYGDDATTVAPSVNPAERGKNKNKNNQYGGGDNNNNSYDNNNNGNNNGNNNSNYGGNNNNGNNNSNYGGNNNNQPTQKPYGNPEPTVNPNPDPNDMCWHCDEPTLELCQQKGMMKSCRAPAAGHSNVCMVELRQRDGGMFGICMGCKDQDTCMNQRSNNFMFGKKWKLNQCQPKASEGPSVCRSCCKGKNCWGTNANNFVLRPESTVGDWMKDYLY